MTRWQRMRTAVFLSSIGLVRRMTLGTRAMLIDGRSVLLIRHTYVPGWHFPGGGIEPGETALDSVVREVREETGYALTERPELFGFYHNARISRRDHVAFYVSRRFEKQREFRPNPEIAEIGWFDVDALPEDAGGGTHRRITEVFAGADIDPIW